MINILYSLLGPVIMTVGLWNIFGKCGIDRRWAFCPVFRLYKLSICANRRDAGKRLMDVTVIRYFLRFFELFADAVRLGGSITLASLDAASNYTIDRVDTYTVIILALDMAVLTASAVYSIRIYIGLCETFGRRKRWLWLWIFAEGLTAVIWGFVPSFRPVEKEEEREDEISSISSIDLKKAEGVLDINIRERTSSEILNRRQLLKDIRVTIEPGTMVLLLGGSGAGKTTFVNAVTGYEKADATVTLNGKDVYRDFGKMKYDIGFVPQMDLIRYNDTVRKTVEDAALLKLPKETGREKRREKVDSTLEIFGLHTVQDSLVGKLSGGQKKRTSIATEFVSDPSLFILDEPDSGLDGVLARDLMERLHAISRKGKIVIVITHSPDRVIDLFDRVIILAKDRNGTGRLVFEGTVPDCRSFFSRDTMEDVVKMINRRDEGGEGMGDTLIGKFEEVRKNERA